MKKLFIVCFVVCSLQAWTQTISGQWSGNIKTPGPALKIIIHFEDSGNDIKGHMDIPEQGAKGLPLASLEIKQREISFSLPDVPGDAKFKGVWNAAKDSITGIFSQAGMEMPLKMGKQKPADKPEISLAAKMLRIEAYADSVIKKNKIAGMSIGIIHNGEIIMNRGYGYRDLEQKIKTDHKTLFAIGSSSKAFTTGLMSILADEEKLDWEKPVIHYMPRFKMQDEFATKQMTPVDLVTHRSGLPRHDFSWYGANATRKEIVDRIQYLEPNAPFRTKWQYQNFMYVAAGVLCEEITGEKWEDLMHKKIFTPLKMTETQVYFNEAMKSKNISLGYEVKEGKIVKKEYRNVESVGPAGSIFSNSTDMLKWLKMHLDNGKVNDTLQLISEEQIRFLHTPKILMPMNPAEKDILMSSYAAGWMVDIYKDKKLVHHGGNIDGFSAEVFMVPQEKLGIVVLTNQDGTNVGELISMYAADMILGFEERDWYEEKLGGPMRLLMEKQKAMEEEEKKNKKAEKEKPVKKNPPHHALSSYAGEYENKGYGTIEVKSENNKLYATYNGYTLEMEHDKFECFKAKHKETGMELKLNYFTNSAGKVESLFTSFDPTSSEIKFTRKTINYLKDEKYLAKITGDYDVRGMTLTIKKEGARLIAALSDGQKYELEPSGENMFALKGLKGFNMEFIFDEKGNCIEVVSIQPNGTFSAKRKQ